ASVGQDPGVHARMQGLDPAVQALRKAGDLLHLGDRHARTGDLGRGRPGRHDVHTGVVQALREIGQPGLVVHRDQRPPDRPALRVVGVVVSSWRIGHDPTVTFLPSMRYPSRTIRPTVSTSITRSCCLIRSCRLSTSSPGSTGTATWAMIGPVSTPSSTTNRVAPVIRTPYARASRGACMPGNAGESAGCVLMTRPWKRVRNSGPSSFMKPASTTRSGSYDSTVRRSARFHSSRDSWSATRWT